RFDIIRGNRIPQAGYPRKDYPDSNTLRVSIFAQNELSFNQGKVKLIPGLRFDSYSLKVEANPEFLQKREQPAEFSETNLSPSLGLIYQPNSNVTLFGRYSRGFRPPLYSELNTSFRADIPVRPHKGIPNPDLTAETANNFELGIKTKSKQFDFDVTGFYNRYKDFIEANSFVGFDFNDISFGVPFQIIQSTNIPKAEIYGLEIKGAYRFNPNPGGLYLRGALGWQYGNDLSKDQPLPTIEPLKAVVGLGYQEKADRWGVELTTTFVAKAREQENFVSIASQTFSNARSVIVNPYEPPAYTLVDLRGYYNITPSFGITLGLYNLFDTEYYQYSDVRTIDTSSRVFEAQRGRSGQAGRNLSVGLNWQF
ncbi:MAG: TonB-dependent receptor, partial [Alkalinema sp. RL_2_19]|nr:TonB-dependent receptor [Alkalinema sp. RL_2_19]